MDYLVLGGREQTRQLSPHDIVIVDVKRNKEVKQIDVKLNGVTTPSWSPDGEQLVFPVTGKVTTPAAYVTPEKLELGTACIGSGVSAVV